MFHAHIKVKERAQLGDGMDILELGCGWGSLSLYMAEKFPRSRITVCTLKFKTKVSLV